jgi:hypothetical protein
MSALLLESQACPKTQDHTFVPSGLPESHRILETPLHFKQNYKQHFSILCPLK